MSACQEANSYEGIVDDTIAHFSTLTPTRDEILKSVGKRACSHFVVQVFREEEDRILSATEHADLNHPGLERFDTVLRDEVDVKTEGVERQIARGPIRVCDLKSKLGVRDGYQLIIDRSGRLEPLADDQEIVIHGCEEFDTHQCVGGSS